MAHITVTAPVQQGTGNIHAPTMTDEAAEALCQEIAENYLIAVDPKAPSCCIDGRACLANRSGKKSEPRAKVAGGSLITSYAAAELIGWFAPNDPSGIEDRMRIVADTLAAGGMRCGGHCDAEANSCLFSAGKTGCGANDRLPEIMKNISEAQELVTASTQMLLGEQYDQSTLDVVIGQAQQPLSGEWHALTMVQLLESSSTDNVEVLQSDDQPTHGHYEVMALVNTHEDTTVDRDHLLTDGKPQVFAVDAWYIDKLAHALARGPQAEQQYLQLKHAMVAYQVATLYTLGDGSHRLAVI